MIHRNLTAQLLAALEDTPAGFLHGARQTGKTTLVRALAEGGFPAAYLTLDEAQVFEAATHDPEGFLMQLPTPVILDEIQRAPGLFRALKLIIDRDRRPGKYLLTGSAHLLVLPQLAEALVGRMEVQTLWPLSQGEIEGREERAPDLLFGSDPLPTGALAEPVGDLVERIVHGGYPEAVTRAAAARRRAWFEAYVTTLVQRDLRELAAIDGLAAMPGLLRLLAARATGLLNIAELARSSGVPRTTLKRYLGLFEGVFLLRLIPAWSANLSKRLVRSPKTTLIDSGLLCHLLGIDTAGLAREPQRLGPVLETFVIQELLKQISWSQARPRLFHYRTHGNEEVDILLEDAAGRLVGIEVKARSTATGRDFRSLRTLADLTGDRFHRGVVLHTGTAAVPFGDRFHALPVAWLWRGGI
jgi:predicted AAA+ superfamily ATPase